MRNAFAKSSVTVFKMNRTEYSPGVLRREYGRATGFNRIESGGRGGSEQLSLTGSTPDSARPIETKGSAIRQSVSVR